MKLGDITITLVHLDPTGTRDRYNTLTLEAGDPATTDVDNCRVEQDTTEELLEDRDTIITTWSLFAPAEAPFGDYDQVRIPAADIGLTPDPSQTYVTMELVGFPSLERTNRAAHHWEAHLRRVQL